MIKKHRGAWAELIACAWLLENGYDVFRNVSQHGEIDIIGTKDGDVTYFDVKTVYKLKQSGSRLSPAQIAVGIKPIYITRNGECRIDFDPQSTQRVKIQCGYCTRYFMPRSAHAQNRFCSAVCNKRFHRESERVTRLNAEFDAFLHSPEEVAISLTQRSYDFKRAYARGVAAAVALLEPEPDIDDWARRTRQIGRAPQSPINDRTA